MADRRGLAVDRRDDFAANELRAMVDGSPRVVAQRQRVEAIFAPPVQSRSNRTGLPGGLKTGIENLSGISMDDVRVHYNSAEPARLRAFAYTQGKDIHVAPGRERHLPHEAWHVVQQAQGRVAATARVRGDAINDDAGLEREADHMAARALRAATTPARPRLSGDAVGPAIGRSGGDVVQRAPARYTYSACRDDQITDIEAALTRAYIMVRDTLTEIRDFITARALKDHPDFRPTRSYYNVEAALKREFGPIDQSGAMDEIRMNYERLKAQFESGLDIDCHDGSDPKKNKMAEASIGGNDVSFGPNFFDAATNDPASRPRVFIHEVAHCIGLSHTHAAVGWDEEGEMIEAEISRHADSYATLAVRLRTGNYHGAIARDDNI